jgi:hypothetical protein
MAIYTIITIDLKNKNNVLHLRIFTIIINIVTFVKIIVSVIGSSGIVCSSDFLPRDLPDVLLAEFGNARTSQNARFTGSQFLFLIYIYYIHKSIFSQRTVDDVIACHDIWSSRSIKSLLKRYVFAQFQTSKYV